jgi:glycosyltransferase involved in cell wall biosynthesis
MPLISIVFSYRNEEAVLPLLLGRLQKVMEKESDKFQLIFVDDASTDRSVSVLSSSATTLQCDFVIVQMSRKWGVEECFLAGLEKARGDAVIFMYTDLQDPPEVIHEMLDKWRAGAEIVHTIRTKRLGESRAKIATAWLVYRLIRRMASFPIPADSGEFKLMSRRVADHLGHLRESEPYLRGLIPWIGFAQAFVNYAAQPRAAGQSQVPLFGGKAWTVMMSGIITCSEKPVHLIVLSGAVGTVVTTPWLILSLLSGSESLYPLLSLFWSTLMLALGFVGLYAARS